MPDVLECTNYHNMEKLNTCKRYSYVVCCVCLVKKLNYVRIFLLLLHPQLELIPHMCTCQDCLVTPSATTYTHTCKNTTALHLKLWLYFISC